MLTNQYSSLRQLIANNLSEDSQYQTTTIYSERDMPYAGIKPTTPRSLLGRRATTYAELTISLKEYLEIPD